jgi:hypothetical protein
VSYCSGSRTRSNRPSPRSFVSAATAKARNARRINGRSAGGTRLSTSSMALRRWSSTESTRLRPEAERLKSANLRSSADSVRTTSPLRSSLEQILVAFEAWTASSTATALGGCAPSRAIRTRTRSCGLVTRSSTSITVRAATRRSAFAARSVSSSSSDGRFPELCTPQIIEQVVAPAQSPSRTMKVIG